MLSGDKGNTIMASTNEHIVARYQFALSRMELNSIESDCMWYLNPEAKIGKGTVIRPGVTIGPNVTIGKNCLIKAGARIGEKGFSFGFTTDNRPIPIAHTGRVIIGDNCSIGSGTTVCRGTVDDTVIEDDTHIDDLCHIAHNSHIGPRTCIAAGTILCGSVTVGRSVWIGVNCSIMNKVHVADYTLVGNHTNVTKNFKEFDILVGNPAKVLRSRVGDFIHVK